MYRILVNHVHSLLSAQLIYTCFQEQAEITATLFCYIIIKLN